MIYTNISYQNIIKMKFISFYYFFVSLIVSFWTSKLFINKFSNSKLSKSKLNDENRVQTNFRNHIPIRGGGIAFILSIIIVNLPFVFHKGFNSSMKLTLFCLPLMIIGYLDDYKHIPKHIRFLIQIFSSSLIIFSSPFLTRNISDINIINILLFIFLIIFIISVINFINFTDGIDGLVAGCMIINFTTIAIIKDNSLFTIVGALIGFLIWNWSPAKVFMGDIGSTFLGAFFCGILFYNYELTESIPLILTASPLLADALICLPRRYFHGEPIFRKPHKLHLYQRLEKSGWSHSKISLTYIISTLILSLSFLFLGTIGLSIFLSIEFIYAYYLDQYVALNFKEAI